MKTCIDTLLLRVGLLFFLGAVLRPTVAAESPTLNVVFILADDLGWGELGCDGQRAPLNQ